VGGQPHAPATSTPGKDPVPIYCICQLATNNLRVSTRTGTELLPIGKQWVWLLG